MLFRWVFAVCWLGATLSAQTITVTPMGPIATLEQARDAARAERRAGRTGPIRIEVRAGRYPLNQTFQLGPEDNDTIWQAPHGEHPVISGGSRITGWKEGENGVWSASVRGLSFHQLFINGVRAICARTPNVGFFHIEGDSSQAKPFEFRYRDGDIQKSWAETGDVEVVALLAWADLRRPIVRVDESTRVAVLAGNPEKSNREKDARYYIENARDALDAPGEWYLDRKAQVVYYIPRPGEQLERAEVIATTLETLISINSDPAGSHPVEGIEFRGLTFADADWTMPPTGYADIQSAFYAPATIEVVGARNLVIDHCIITRSGGYGVWFARGAQHNRITATEIFDMGAGGVKIGEPEIRSNPLEQNKNTLVENNHIHDLGKVFVSAVGVWVLESADNQILHNHIHHLFYTAISLGWTWGYGPSQARSNFVAFNDLHDVGQGMLSDMGAIYTLGTQPGTVLRNNLIHDVIPSVYGGWGIYADESSSRILIENNIVYHCKSAAFHENYGQDNLVRNNIFALDDEHEMMRTREEAHTSLRIEHNIIYASQKSILGGNWGGDQFDISNNLYYVVGNVAPDFAGASFAAWKTAGHDQQSIIADPLFVDAAHFNFALRSSSPALKTGFHAIDESKVGPLYVPGATAW